MRTIYVIGGIVNFMLASNFEHDLFFIEKGRWGTIFDWLSFGVSAFAAVYCVTKVAML